MKLRDLGNNLLQHVDPRLIGKVENYLLRIPLVKRRVEQEYGTLMAQVEPSLKPYRGRANTYAKLPEQGLPRHNVLNDMRDLAALEEQRWRSGFASGAVYHGDQGHIDFLNQVYAIYSQANPLHTDLWPSIAKYEAEIISMTAGLFGADSAANSAETAVCGSVSSGGTDSILLAMKTYRDWAKAKKAIKHPEMVVPVTAHAAFDKAAQYFNIRMVRIPVDGNYRADIKVAKKAITRNTIVLVGSACSFPHGVIDPIEELSELARQHDIGFHTDACLGGFVLPFARKLGYPVPDFDFRLPGVTSISVDTHKYGYAAKGSSVVLYRGRDLRSYQFYVTSNWPGGLYFSPTFAGSRPGALSAACWASLVSMGEQGYLDATRSILETAAKIRRGIEQIPELYILGDPLWVLAFSSRTLDIYRVMDFMTARQWSLNGLHKPSAIHLCVTLRHTLPEVADHFLSDLRDAVQHVRNSAPTTAGMAPVYGMAATLPLRGVVDDLLKRYLDLLYKV